MLSAALVAVELAGKSGFDRVWPAWLLGYADLQVLLLTCWMAAWYVAAAGPRGVP